VLGRAEEHASLFRFEGTDWRWDARCISAEEAHFARISLSVASQGWTWGAAGGDTAQAAAAPGVQADLLDGFIDGDGDVDVLLHAWAEGIKQQDPAFLPPGHTHECLCHLVWPLANFRFHNCKEVCHDEVDDKDRGEVGADVSAVSAEEEQEEEEEAYINAMQTALVNWVWAGPGVPRVEAAQAEAAHAGSLAPSAADLSCAGSSGQCESQRAGIV
jgi:hypothetical protein